MASPVIRPAEVDLTVYGRNDPAVFMMRAKADSAFARIMKVRCS
jgi:hypothetical protein